MSEVKNDAPDNALTDRLKDRALVALSPKAEPVSNDLSFSHHAEVFPTSDASPGLSSCDIVAGNLASGLKFNLLHPTFQVNRERRLLMREPGDISTVFSASKVKSFTSVRAELRIQDFVMTPITKEQLLEKLGRLESNVTRAQMAPCQARLFEHFRRCFLSAKLKEAEIYDGVVNFFVAGSKTVSDLYSICSPCRLLPGRLSGSVGILAKIDPSTGLVDKDAGYCGECDAVLPFGLIPTKTLLAAELKHFLKKPTTDVWYAQSRCLLAQLLGSMVGHGALLGLYLSNFGYKVLMMDRPQDPAGFTRCFVCDIGDKIIPLHSGASTRNILDAFDIFLEILRLSLPRNLPLEPLTDDPELSDLERERLAALLGNAGQIAAVPQAAPELPGVPQTVRLQTNGGTVIELEPLSFTEEEKHEIEEVLKKERAVEKELKMFGYREDDVSLVPAALISS
jgi:hypothetical protein